MTPYHRAGGTVEGDDRRTLLMGWKQRTRDRAGQNDDDDPYLGTSHLVDGESMTVEFRGDGEEVESDQYGEGVRFPVTVIQTDGEQELSRKYDLAPGDDAALVSWGVRLPQALMALIDDLDTDDLTGLTVRTDKFGSGVETTYRAHRVEE
jgi:hypothetical protein